MPAQKRSRENSPEDLPDSNDAANQEQLQQEMEASDRSPSNDGSEVEKEENFIMVKLSEVRKEVQCPICLGIIRKTRTVMECLHRFCRECIDKSMRLGNKECPACRKHCASRRSLRDDPNYDALIAALYPDIDRYEEEVSFKMSAYEREELAFHDEENARNKQIQASIKQTFEHQLEALRNKKKRSRNVTRRRSIPRTADEDIANNVSSPDESPETRIKRVRRFSRNEQLSPAKAIEEDGGNEEHDDGEANKETGNLYNGGLVAETSEMLAWGKGGTRSHTRSGNGNTKYARTNRLARLVDHLRNLEENNELDIHIVFVCLEGEKTPALAESHLCCRPAFSVRQLCEFIAGQTSLEASEVEILVVKKVQSKLCTRLDVHHVANTGSIIEACKDELQLLDGEQTVGGVKDAYYFSQGHMLLAYRQKSVRRVVGFEPS